MEDQDNENMSFKDHKIKYIYSFFEKKYSEEISNKILTIIDNYNIDYTINKNGIFINLNVIDEEILHLIYDCIISSTKCETLTAQEIQTCQKVSKIITTDVALKGQTVSSSYKPATLDNGLNIQVPPFIESGDKVIIDTRTFEYIKKI